MSTDRGKGHHVLQTPELLDNIFRYLSARDLSQAAQVAKIWSEAALPVLWDDVNNLRRLFSILSPLAQQSRAPYTYKTQHKFVECPSADQWSRFDKYATLVHKLSYDPQPRQETKILSRSALQDVAISRPRYAIFRNLRWLAWTPSPEFQDYSNFELSDASLFMHENITFFAFSFGRGASEATCQRFLTDIPLRMPHLRDIELRRITEPLIPPVEAALVEMLGKLVQLKRIAMPSFLLTERVFEALSQQPFLETIDYSVARDLDDDDVAPGKFLPHISADGFPQLRHLKVTSSFGDFAETIKSAYVSERLEHLYLHSHGSVEPLQILHELLLAICDKTEKLKSLVLTSKRMFRRDGGPDENENICADWTILRPVAQLSLLSHLEIVSFFPVKLSSPEVKTLVLSLPRLETLFLNQQPSRIHESELGLDVIGTISDCCPQLRRLGLFLNAIRAIPEHVYTANAGADAQIDFTPHSFPHLEELSVGFSIINSPAVSTASLYLSKVLPPRCKIDAGYNQSSEVSALVRSSSAFSNAVTGRSKLWTRVAELLKLFIQVRQDERNKIRSQLRRKQEV